MDGQRFDDLTRTLASGASRRRVLQGVGGVVIGGALSLLGVGRGGAQTATVGVCHRTGSTTHPYEYIKVDEQSAAAHLAHSDAVGVDLQTDPLNCGTCGNICPGDKCNTPVCQAGECGKTLVVCNDQNTCTTDTCDPLSGCVFTNNTASCVATGGVAGTCTNGVCMLNAVPYGEACDQNTDCEAGWVCRPPDTRPEAGQTCNTTGSGGGCCLNTAVAGGPCDEAADCRGFGVEDPCRAVTCESSVCVVREYPAARSRLTTRLASTSVRSRFAAGASAAPWGHLASTGRANNGRGRASWITLRGLAKRDALSLHLTMAGKESSWPSPFPHGGRTRWDTGRIGSLLPDRPGNRVPTFATD